MTRTMTRAPGYAALPTARPRSARGGPKLRELRVRLEAITPILGGSHQTRAIDEVDVLAALSVRRARPIPMIAAKPLTCAYLPAAESVE